MSTTWIDVDEVVTSPPAPTSGRGRLARLVRGREDDPAWIRPGLLLLLAATAVLYLWNLSASGWANSFYAAAVEAGSHSWKAFFFGSFDSSNFITVDKPPAALWVMEISARIFGLNSWSVLVPQALEGVAAVGLLYATVRRTYSATAGLVAGAVLALTPVATLMFRFNNPDALLTLLLVGSAYSMVRALEAGKTRWLVLAGTLIGLGFITKMLQAVIVVPGFALVYLVCGPLTVRRRVMQLLAGGLALVVAAGWWLAAVTLTPAADRPYVGGSTNNSIWQLIFGYNGFGRLTGNETGSVGGGGGRGNGGGMWGSTGITRLFGSDMGTQISWLLPAALLLGLAALWFTRRHPRTDLARAQLLLWGSWLVVTGLVFSYGQGIIHPYYTVVLAPAIGAVVAGGGVLLWRRRESVSARLTMAGVVAFTAVWAYRLLDRTPTWHPALRDLIIGLGIAAAIAILVPPTRWGRYATRAGVVVAAAAIGVGLAAPAAYSLDTASTAHEGAIPSAGPAGQGGPGGGRPGGGPGGFGRGSTHRGFQPPTGTGTRGFGTSPFGGSTGQGGQTGQGFGGPGFGLGGQGFGGQRFGGQGFGPQGFGGQGGRGAGGLLNAGTPSAALTEALRSNASSYTWVAATVGSESASGYQLAAKEPVMAIGGFNGTDPTPSLAQFEAYVAAGKIHYFIGGGGFGQGMGGSADAEQIAQWVESHFTAKTIGGVTVYDLTQRSTTS